MKKYQQLFKLIEQDILSEKYPVGEFLPSENELTLANCSTKSC